MRASNGCRRLALFGAALFFSFFILHPSSLRGENRLAGSTSRYLLQHAQNPVDWYPWGPEAFAKARETKKLVFLSIGYSTCHWCHVMEQESFSDPAIAKLMNEVFVSIKVDREERPDIDSVYLAVTRALTGDAGWPNNVVLTPDGQPFFATSYVHKDKLTPLIERLQQLWVDQRDTVTSSAAMVTAALKAAPQQGEALDESTLTKGYQQLVSRFDKANGGFLPEPKFPTPHHLLFLLRYWSRTNDARALSMVETTLRAMRDSPLRDPIGFGFHRYSTRANWGEPHYEKMLYDQAMLAMAYTETYQATRKQIYAQVAREIFTYVLRDLRAPNGAFYSAQDADAAYYTGRDRAGLKPPARDEKIIADWNGLMIAALSLAASVLDEPKYAEAARAAAEAVIPKRRPFLDDHAFMVWGLLNLYEATFEVEWLDSAIAIEAETRRLFSDESGAFYLTPADGEALLLRPRESGDGAIPSGNSVELMNLVRLSRITADAAYETAAKALLRSVSDDVALAPSASTHLLSGLGFLLGPSQEIVLAGRDVAEMRRAVYARYAPNKVVLHRPPGEARITEIAPYTEQQLPIRGKATAYVCTNFMCRLPVTDPARVWGGAAVIKIEN